MTIPPPPARSGTASRPADGTIFEQEGNATRFVYVIDRSDSMDGERLEVAKRHLIAKIRSLKPHMSFFVIFYNTGAEDLGDKSLVKATPANKKRYVTWIENMYATGGTDPTIAMTRAITLQPQTIWLLTDGRFQEPQKIISAIRRTNRGKRIIINTIAFHDKDGEDDLKLIARENKGEYRFVPR